MAYYQNNTVFISWTFKYLGNGECQLKGSLIHLEIKGCLKSLPYPGILKLCFDLSVRLKLSMLLVFLSDSRRGPKSWLDTHFMLTAIAKWKFRVISSWSHWKLTCLSYWKLERCRTVKGGCYKIDLPVCFFMWNTSKSNSGQNSNKLTTTFNKFRKTCHSVLSLNVRDIKLGAIFLDIGMCFVDTQTFSSLQNTKIVLVILLKVSETVSPMLFVYKMVTVLLHLNLIYLECFQESLVPFQVKKYFIMFRWVSSSAHTNRLPQGIENNKYLA